MKGWVGGCAAVCLVISMEKQEEEELTQMINSEAVAPVLCSAPAREAAH